jgi:hypothetical protein
VVMVKSDLGRDTASPSIFTDLEPLSDDWPMLG